MKESQLCINRKEVQGNISINQIAASWGGLGHQDHEGSKDPGLQGPGIFAQPIRL